MESRPYTEPTERIPASITALSVAMATVRSLETGHNYLLNNYPIQLLKEIIEIALENEPVSFNWGLMKTISISSYAMQQSFFNKVVTPSYDEVILLRKAAILYKIKEALENGVKQIVFLGGGYDVAAIATALKNPDIKIYEIDRGSTRDNKLIALNKKYMLSTNDACSTLINDNYYSIECDLSHENISSVLIKNNFDHGFKTLVIAEGLTMYLDKSENEQLLKSMHELACKEEDEVFLSYVTNIGYTAITDKAQTNSNEKYKFYLPSDNVISFLQDNGFNVTGKTCSCDMLQQIGDDEGHNYYQNPSKAREIYYLLKKCEFVPQLILDIDEVEKINIQLPFPPQKNEEDSICLVM